jgi:AraC-like DNA-binding protein
MLFARTKLRSLQQPMVWVVKNKIEIARMMISAQKLLGQSFPFSVEIDAVEPRIDRQLRQLMGHDVVVNGGVERLRLNEQMLTLDDPIPNFLASGSEVAHFIAPGFAVYVVESMSRDEWSVTARPSQDCLRLRFPAAGGAEYKTDDRNVIDELSSCTFIVQPAGAVLTGVYRAESPIRLCSLHLSKALLTERLGIPEARLPAALLGSWQRQEVAFGRVELDRATMALVPRLLALRATDDWTRIQAEGLALMLLAQVLEGWSNERRPSTVVTRLKAGERAALTRLRTIADERCPRSLSIDEATSLCGLNRNKIHYGFKEMFGTSLQRYCSEVRMRSAAELLQDPARSIGAIAEALGYSEPTNFTAAFQRHFRERPSAFRRRFGRPPGD